MHYKITRGNIDINGLELSALLPSVIKKDARRTLEKMPDLRFSILGEGTLERGNVSLASEGTAATSTSQPIICDEAISISSTAM